ncbi:MAG: ATP-binding protein [Proteobacteria bacterium]|nr:ATP-binding protein [Pseudomonadota bacterium]
MARKALLKYDFTEKLLMARGKFKSCISYQGISDYVQKRTFLDYHGRDYRLTYAEERLTVTKMVTDGFIEQPKIMYVPSERNFLSSLAKPSTIAGLQPSLITFLDEFESAKRAISASIVLPVGQSSYSYDKLNDVSWVERHGNRTRLIYASSGYQSLVPQFLVIDYLANLLVPERMAVTPHQMRLIREALNKLPNTDRLASGTPISVLKESPFITLDDIRSSPKAIQQIFKRFRPSHTINVVEEPEQNLFPESQTRMMYSLLGHRNRNPLNQLIITTHSPYVLGAVTLAVGCSVSSPTLDCYHYASCQQILDVPQFWLVDRGGSTSV